MVFNSLTFLVFLAFVLLIYYRLKHRAQNIFLLFASYVFYGWWDVRFLFLLIGTSLFDFYCAHWIEAEVQSNRRKRLLIASITLNMSVLCVFKYFGFFAESLEKMLSQIGYHPGFPTLHILLPVGISFYTFLSMSYTIDVYRGEMKAARDPVDFLLVVAFFPHLVAGPIVRASYLLPQCLGPRHVQSREVANGVWLILLGFFKKVVIGDRLAQVVDMGFAQSQPPFSDANAWLIVYAFAFQIYADFSGYSDIARGLSKLMGFELVENFKSPYLVTNPAAFWRHWHMSLSTWLRDYLYIPLGGNRTGVKRTYLNLLIVMVLGGLWHGAGIAFLVWGLYQGMLLIAYRLGTTFWGGKAILQTRWMRIVATVVFFHLVCLGWLIFRAGTLHSQFDQIVVIKNYLTAMTHFSAWEWNDLTIGVGLLCGVGFLLQWKNNWLIRFSEWPTKWQTLSVIGILLAIASLGVFEGAQFIYFQF